MLREVFKMLFKVQTVKPQNQQPRPVLFYRIEYPKGDVKGSKQGEKV